MRGRTRASRVSLFARPLVVGQYHEVVGTHSSATTRCHAPRAGASVVVSAESWPGDVRCPSSTTHGFSDEEPGEEEERIRRSDGASPETAIPRRPLLANVAGQVAAAQNARNFRREKWGEQA